MSAHYSKYLLNTYAATLYFQAHVPAEYPLDRVLIKSRAFRRLPPRLLALAGLAKIWACRSYPFPAGIEGIEHWYGADGHELDPETGRRLTDAEIDAQWPAPDAGLAAFVVGDIPLPRGGFADPAVWEPAPDDERNLVDRAGLTEEQVLGDIASRGRDRTAAAYGVPAAWLGKVANDDELVRLILDMDGKPWPAAA